VDERASDQETPAHAARELVDPRVAPVLELRHLERAFDRVAPLGAADPVQVGEDEQVLLDGERRVEVVELRGDAGLGAGLLGLTGRLNPRTSISPSSAIDGAVRSRVVVDVPALFGPSRSTHVPSGTSRSSPATR
jgi:hypothetical protein